MKSERIIVVSGLARCGTSLMMRMLHAAGIEPYCEPGFTGMGNSYETENMIRLPQNSGWVSDCKGKAVKIMDPARFTPPAGFAYDVIWMDRNVRQQALSHLKLKAENEAWVNKSPEAITARMAHLKRQRKKCLRVWKRLGARVHTVRFEDILGDPVAASVPIVPFLGIGPENGFTAARMAHQVQKRSPDCLSYMAEYRLASGYRGELSA